MARKNEYERHYREGRGVCGEPFPELAAFFDAYGRSEADVLDLGCGQGRDALLAARRGHHVVGVDLSETGVAQMLEDASAEGLDVEGVVADIAEWEPADTFDVVILDRVLHLLSDDAERERVLERSCTQTRPSGHVLVADTPKQQEMLRAFFESKRPNWEVTLRQKGFVFARRVPPESN
jgi:2-polyprenyl-3-methyl-5-hydroxy-6-metoxy-1,4-benzoquinol methylase